MAIIGGRQTKAWRPIAGRANEGLDLTIYALAALYSMGPQFLGTLGTLASARAQSPAPIVQPSAHGVSVPAAVVRPSRGGFVGGWRR